LPTNDLSCCPSSVFCPPSSVFSNQSRRYTSIYRGTPIVPFGSAHHRPCRQLPRSFTIKQRTSSNDQFISREAYFAASRFTRDASRNRSRRLKKIIVIICKAKSSTPYDKTTYENSPPSIQSIWRTIQRQFDSANHNLESNSISIQANWRCFGTRPDNAKRYPPVSLFYFRLLY